MVIRRIRPDRPYLCADCAEKRAIMAVVSMATRSGEFWDRYQAAKRARATRPPDTPEGT